MDQYSPTYSNDRAAKDQTALLIALVALLGAALMVVFVLGAQGPSSSAKDRVEAVKVADMQRPVTALAGTFAGVLAAPLDGPPTMIGGPANTSYPGIKGRITALLQNDLGLWAATTGAEDTPPGIVLVRNALGAMPFVQKIALPPNLAGAEIRALVTGMGRLWIGTSRGLLTYDWGKLNAFTPPSRFRLPGMNNNLDVTALYLDNAGTLWVGTRDGLLSYNGTEAFRHTMKEGLPSNKVTALSGDQAGLLFCGTESGLAAFERGIWVRHSEVGDHVNAVLAAEDNVWVGTQEGLFQRLEGRWAKVNAEPKLPSAAVLALAWGSDGVYVSTDQGLYKLEMKMTAVALAEAEAAKAAGETGTKALDVHGPAVPPQGPSAPGAHAPAPAGTSPH